jgi:hypothetical protein
MTDRCDCHLSQGHAVATEAAVPLVKTAGQLGLSPVAERNLGSFTPPSDGDDPYAGG